MANEETKIPDRKFELLKPAEGIKYVYCNNFLIGQTVFDVRLLFGEVTDVTDEKIEVTQRVQVTMSWLETKALSESLAAIIKHHEDTVGIIRTEFPFVTNPPLPQIPLITLPKTQK